MRGDTLPLTLLTFLALGSPWPFGSVDPGLARGLAVASLLAAALISVRGAAGAGIALPALPLWPLAGLLAVALLQLAPVPGLQGLAAGPRAVWHPAASEAAAVLEAGPRPLSLVPEATRAWLGFTGAFVGLGLLAATAASDRRRLVRAAVAAVAGGLLVSVYGVVARTLFGPLLYGRIPVPTLAPFGPFVSKNHFAGYVEMAAMLALGLAVGLAGRERSSADALSWAASPRSWQVLTAYAVALAMALSVLVSLSRGGAVSLAAGVLAFFVFQALVRRRRPSRGSRLVGLAAAGLLLVAVAAVVPREARDRIATLRAAGTEQAASFRLRVWGDVMGMARESPWVGYGLGAFASAFPAHKTANGELRVEHAENDYLELLAEAGLLGLGLGLAALVLGARAVVAGLSRQHDRLARGIGLGALAGVVALLVHSAFDFNLHIPSNAILFALLGALALGAAGERRTLVGPGAWVFVALLLACLAAAAWPRGPASLDPARRSLATALAIEDAGARRLRLGRADAALTEWLRGRPADAEAWLLLGWARVAEGRGEGLALARHGVGLDPTRVELRRELGRFAPASRVAPSP